MWLYRPGSFKSSYVDSGSNGRRGLVSLCDGGDRSILILVSVLPAVLPLVPARDDDICTYVVSTSDPVDSGLSGRSGVISGGGHGLSSCVGRGGNGGDSMVLSQTGDRPPVASGLTFPAMSTPSPSIW